MADNPQDQFHELIAQAQELEQAIADLETQLQAVDGLFRRESMLKALDALRDRAARVESQLAAVRRQLDGLPESVQTKVAIDKVTTETKHIKEVVEPSGEPKEPQRNRSLFGQPRSEPTESEPTPKRQALLGRPSPIAPEVIAPSPIPVDVIPPAPTKIPVVQPPPVQAAVDVAQPGPATIPVTQPKPPEQQQALARTEAPKVPSPAPAQVTNSTKLKELQELAATMADVREQIEATDDPQILSGLSKALEGIRQEAIDIWEGVDIQQQHQGPKGTTSQPHTKPMLGDDFGEFTDAVREARDEFLDWARDLGEFKKPKVDPLPDSEEKANPTSPKTNGSIPLPGLLSTLTRTITEAFRSIVQAPKKVFQTVNKKVGGVAGNLFGAKTGPAVGKVAGGAAAGLTGLAVAGGAAVASVQALSSAAQGLASMFRSSVEAFSPAIVRRFMDRFQDMSASIGAMAAPLMEALGQTLLVFNRFYTGLRPIIEPLFAQLGGIIRQFTESYLSAIRPVVEALVPLAGMLLDVIGSLVPVFGQLLSGVYSVAAGLLQAVRPILNAIVAPFVQVMQQLGPAMQRVYAAFQMLGESLGDALAELVSALMQLFTPFQETILNFVVPLLVTFAETLAMTIAVMSVTMDRIRDFFTSGILNLSGIVAEAQQNLQNLTNGNNLGNNTTIAAQQASRVGIEDVARRAQLAALGVATTQQIQNNMLIQLQQINTNTGNNGGMLGVLQRILNLIPTNLPNAVNAAGTATQFAINPAGAAWDLFFGS